MKDLHSLLIEQGFASRSTSSIGKKNLENEIYTNQYFSTPCSSSEYIIGLCGNGDGLKRHIDNYTRLGCNEENQVFVEFDKSTMESIVRYKKILNADVSLILGDIKSVVRKHISKFGKNLYLIDYDSIEAPGPAAFNWIDECVTNKYSKYLLVVLSASRGPTGNSNKEYLKNISDNYLKLPRIRKQIAKPKEEYTIKDLKRAQELKKQGKQPINYIKTVGENQLPKIDIIMEKYINKKYNIDPIVCKSYRGKDGQPMFFLLLKT